MARNVGNSIPKATAFALAILVTLVVAGLLIARTFRDDPSTRRLRMATGNAGGTYHAVGEALRREAVAAGVVGELELRDSAGSEENAELLHSGETDLTFLQSDTMLPPETRIICELYEEVLHIVVAEGSGIRTLRDLSGKRVCLGPANSGTRAVARRLLQQFDIEPAEERAAAMQQVIEPLLSGELDCAFLLTAAPSALVDSLCDRGATLLSLGDPEREGNLADAMHAVQPALHRRVLPEGLYGRQPAAPCQAIALSALLVAHHDVPVTTICDFTRILFERRSMLARDPGIAAVFGQLREHHDPSRFLVPYHEGATSYFARKEPPFLVKYAEATSLVLTVLAGGLSLALGFAKWVARRRKNRIDAYYHEVREATDTLAVDEPASRAQVREHLLNIRQRAFEDLINERVEANESFTIFQDYVTHELDNLGESN